MRLPILASCLLLLAACEQAGAPDPVPQPAQTTPPAGKAEAAASIMRPEVVVETAPETLPPATEPLAARVGFPETGTTLDDAQRAVVDAFLADPRFDPGASVTLSGHSDSLGSDRANLDASLARARAVQAYLVEKGVPADRITLIALGERRPLAPNAKPDGSDDPEGRARNRRVDIRVTPPSPPESTEGAETV